MNFSFLVLLSFLVVLIQRVLIPFNWSLALVLLTALFREKRQAFWLALIIGLILDFFSLQSLGLSSFLFLTISFLVSLIRHHFLISYLPVIFFLAFIADLFYHLLVFNGFIFKKSFFFALLFLGIYFLIFTKQFKKKRGLKLS